MSQALNDGTSLLDPFGLWKQTRDANLDAWAKFMVDIVNSDEYSQATGRALSQALALSQPFRQALERSMTSTLQALNMPSRVEVAGLAERQVNIEFRLDDLDARLSTMQTTLLASVREAVREAVQDVVRDAVQDSVKDVVRQALTAPTRYLRDIDAHLVQMDARIKALQDRTNAPPASGAPPAEQGQEVAP